MTAKNDLTDRMMNTKIEADASPKAAVVKRSAITMTAGRRMAIREWSKGGYSVERLSKTFGLSTSMIRSVLRGKNGSG